jgi:hypothetical protein
MEVPFCCLAIVLKCGHREAAYEQLVVERRARYEQQNLSRSPFPPGVPMKSNGN